MTKTITVQVTVPVNVEIEVDELNQDSILDALWTDLKDPDSNNTWEADYDTLKCVVRDASGLDTVDEGFYIVTN